MTNFVTYKPNSAGNKFQARVGVDCVDNNKLLSARKVDTFYVFLNIYKQWSSFLSSSIIILQQKLNNGVYTYVMYKKNMFLSDVFKTYTIKIYKQSNITNVAWTYIT